MTGRLRVRVRGSRDGTGDTGSVPTVTTFRTLTVTGSLGASLLLFTAATSALPGLGDSDLVVPSSGGGLWWSFVGCLVLQAMLLASLWSRRGPAVAGVSAVALIAALLGAGDATGTTSVMVLVAAYRVGAGGPVRVSLSWIALAGLLIALATSLSTSSGSPDERVLVGLLQAVTTLSVPLLLGAFVRSQRDAREARSAETRALEQAHDALVREAIARERTTIARELHDVAAHHLTGITVLSGALDRQITADPEGARVAVADVRQQSKALLKDLRRLVTLLRDGAEAEALPGAGLPEVEDLVTALRSSGTEVRLSVNGARWRRELGPLASRAAFRTVQESLTNAARHAPGAACEVLVDDDADHVLVEVSNTATATLGAGAGSGLGLVGMRERAELLGGHLDAGPTADGGWRVSLTLPLEAAS